MFRPVKEVTAHEDYTLTVVFDNDDTGVLDMKPTLDFGVFRQLKDYDVFKTVRVSFDTIEWECGVDLDPEFVYAKCVVAFGASRYMNNRGEFVLGSLAWCPLNSVK